MTTILASAASGLQHSQTVLDVVGNNLANVNTFAFKKVRAVAQGRPDATTSPDAARLGVSDTTTDIIYTAGAPQSTDDPLNFTIQDDAFFRVHDTDGTIAYSRQGQLSADSAGNITMYGGRFLEPPVTLPQGLTNPAIDSTGQITALDGTGTPQQVGQLTVVRFMNPMGLETAGNGLYRETVNSGPTTDGTPGTAGFAPIIPRTLEGSNVEVAEEFTNMIIAQRSYSASAKTFSVGDEMLSVATNLTR